MAVQSPCGNTSASAVLTVNVPPCITNAPPSQTVAQGGNVTFTVGAGGTAPLSYQWTFNVTTQVGTGPDDRRQEIGSKIV